ncbi:hypothetical protein FZEAL_1420 [Fusarium zealandicum]|uniref:Uncharacterized protein n=1 Tax=Fusarium zealandicum TaxID=1053134 RepID=A0A8H4XPH9_9HYPO|nr:hypothetical protein FZEAL_1420 [Fusarium zealandicum]
MTKQGRRQTARNTDSNHEKIVCSVGTCGHGIAHFSTSGGYSPYYCRNRESENPQVASSLTLKDACWAGPLVCDRRTKNGEKYCEDHAFCSEAGCNSRLDQYNFKYSDIQGAWFCPMHACTKRDESNRRCFQRRNGPATQYCADHAVRNRCAKESCHQDRARDSRFCEQHSCRTNGCLREVHLGGLNRWNCTHHQSCSAPGCGNFCVVGLDRFPMPFCAGHRVCQASGLRPACETVVPIDSLYCTEHKCGMAGCELPRRIPGSHWCQDHSIPMRPVMNPMDNRDGGRRPVYGANPYGPVANHYPQGAPPYNPPYQDRVCNADNCQLRKAGGKDFCRVHQCLNEACHQIAKLPRGYCADEACGRDNCAARRDTADEDNPNLCRHHGREQLREESFSEGEEAGRRAAAEANHGERARERQYAPMHQRFRPFRPHDDAEAIEQQYRRMDAQNTHHRNQWNARR